MKHLLTDSWSQAWRSVESRGRLLSCRLRSSKPASPSCCCFCGMRGRFLGLRASGTEPSRAAVSSGTHVSPEQLLDARARGAREAKRVAVYVCVEGRGWRRLHEGQDAAEEEEGLAPHGHLRGTVRHVVVVVVDRLLSFTVKNTQQRRFHGVLMHLFT